MKYFTVLFVLIETSSAFWFGSTSVDCVWLNWKDAKCVQDANGNYRMMEKREKIEAENGGKPCSGTEVTRMVKPCAGPQVVASTVLETVGSLPGTPTSAASVSKDSSNEECATTFTDSSSGVTMLSATKCSNSRKRRNADTNFLSRMKRQFGGQVSDTENRDILFLIDSSGSVSQTNFQKEIKLAKTLADQFCDAVEIGKDRTRVATMTFDSTSQLHISFDDYYNRNDFLDAMDKIPYAGGSTNLIGALEVARTQIFTSGKGSRVAGSGYDGVIILITDGCIDYFPGGVKAELERQQNLLEDMGITVVLFMIGVQANCVEDMRALQDGSQCYQGFGFNSWSALDSTILQLQEMPCINRWTKMAATCP